MHLKLVCIIWRLWVCILHEEYGNYRARKVLQSSENTSSSQAHKIQHILPASLCRKINKSVYSTMATNHSDVVSSSLFCSENYFFFPPNLIIKSRSFFVVLLKWNGISFRATLISTPITHYSTYMAQWKSNWNFFPNLCRLPDVLHSVQLDTWTWP